MVGQDTDATVTCKSTRYGPGCGHAVESHDGDQARSCCCCNWRHNDPAHVQDCLECSVKHIKRRSRDGVTVGEVADQLPDQLRQRYYRQSIDRYFTEQGIDPDDAAR